MEKKICVSVIVPAYNAELVVENCLKSIMEQSLKNIEIIVVEDGSKDSTRDILKALASEDSRIQLILKDKNEGLSAGRNSAMKIANGEYIGFVDADDWVERDYFKTMYEEGQSADLIVAGYLHDAMDEDRKDVNVSRNVSMENSFHKFKKDIVSEAAYIDTSKMFAYTWNKLYKRDLIKRYEMNFSKQVLIEDFLFNTEYWDKINSLSIVNCTGYHYVKASKDALTQKFLPNFLSIMDIRFESMKNLMKKNNVYDGEVKRLLANVYIKHALAGVVRNCSSKGNYSFKEQIEKIEELLKQRNSIETIKYAKGKTKQEKVCNLIFKTKSKVLILLFAKTIYMMQTKSKTAFDKMK